MGHGHSLPGNLKKHQDGNKGSAAGKDFVNTDKEVYSTEKNKATEGSPESPWFQLSTVLKDHKGNLSNSEELLEKDTKQKMIKGDKDGNQKKHQDGNKGSATDKDVANVDKEADSAERNKASREHSEKSLQRLSTVLRNHKGNLNNNEQDTKQKMINKKDTKCDPKVVPNKELMEGDAKAAKNTKEPKTIEGGKQCSPQYVVCKASELKVVGKADSRSGSESKDQDYDEHRASSRGWEHQHCDEHKQCCTHEDGNSSEESEGKKDSDSSSATSDKDASCSTCSSKDSCAKDSCAKDSSKEELCCCCGHKGKKGAPVSRNYTKMRNRLRGILERKREIVEYFEHHPVKPERRDSQPQQVTFQYQVI